MRTTPDNELREMRHAETRRSSWPPDTVPPANFTSLPPRVLWPTRPVHYGLNHLSYASSYPSIASGPPVLGHRTLPPPHSSLAGQSFYGQEGFGPAEGHSWQIRQRLAHGNFGGKVEVVLPGHHYQDPQPHSQQQFFGHMPAPLSASAQPFDLKIPPPQRFVHPQPISLTDPRQWHYSYSNPSPPASATYTRRASAQFPVLPPLRTPQRGVPQGRSAVTLPKSSLTPQQSAAFSNTAGRVKDRRSHTATRMPSRRASKRSSLSKPDLVAASIAKLSTSKHWSYFREVGETWSMVLDLDDNTTPAVGIGGIRSSVGIYFQLGNEYCYLANIAVNSADDRLVASLDKEGSIAAKNDFGVKLDEDIKRLFHSSITTTDGQKTRKVWAENMTPIQQTLTICVDKPDAMTPAQALLLQAILEWACLKSPVSIGRQPPSSTKEQAINVGFANKMRHAGFVIEQPGTGKIEPKWLCRTLDFTDLRSLEIVAKRLHEGTDGIWKGELVTGDGCGRKRGAWTSWLQSSKD